MLSAQPFTIAMGSEREWMPGALPIAPTIVDRTQPDDGVESVLARIVCCDGRLKARWSKAAALIGPSDPLLANPGTLLSAQYSTRRVSSNSNHPLPVHLLPCHL